MENKADYNINDSSLKEFCSECDEIMQRLTEAFIVIEKGGADAELLKTTYRDIHTLKGNAYLFEYQELGDLAHLIEAALEPLKEDLSLLSAELVRTIYSAFDLVTGMIAALNKSGKKLKVDKLFQLTIKKLLEQDIKLAKEAGLEVTNSEATGTETQVSLHLVTQKVVTQKDHDDYIDQSGQNRESSTVRVNVELLDRLMTQVGNLVLVRNQLMQYANKVTDIQFGEISQQLDFVTREIQEEVVKTRMQPMGNVLNKLHRIVRDLSKEFKKEIELNLYGTDIELDKALLEAIKDPLMHIVRNSCDHGIENREARIAAGKAAGGKISIKSFHEGGQVITEIQDDGHGLDREKILARAVAMGIVRADKTSSLSDREVNLLIFESGFSTADNVSTVSGRGVGMDVVKNNIERMGGVVEVESVAGQGTLIRLKIPLTLAIIPAIIVRSLNDRLFVVPQIKLAQLVWVERGAKERMEYVFGRPVLKLDGNIVYLIDLREVLSDEFSPSESRYDGVNILVLKGEKQMFGLIVDEILSGVDIVVKSLSNSFVKTAAIYSGVTVLGDGSVALILNINEIGQILNSLWSTHASSGNRWLKA